MARSRTDSGSLSRIFSSWLIWSTSSVWGRCFSPLGGRIPTAGFSCIFFAEDFQVFQVAAVAVHRVWRQQALLLQVIQIVLNRGSNGVGAGGLRPGHRYPSRWYRRRLRISPM